MGQLAIMGPSTARRPGSLWWRPLAACAIALTLGIGQAHAEIENAHEGGQGRDKEASALSAEKRGGDAGGQAIAAARALAPDSIAAQPAETVSVEPQVAETASETVQRAAVVAVDGEEDTAPTTRTRTTTRTVIRDGYVVSRTRSKTVSFDEDGNRAVARAVARARAPNDVAAIQAGAGRIVAKASVDIAGSGAGSAAAGGSIGISGGRVDVATWGRTSAEVF
jgi:hypothetical protein